MSLAAGDLMQHLSIEDNGAFNGFTKSSPISRLLLHRQVDLCRRKLY